MKIKEKSGNIVDVYAIYWGSGGGTWFYGMPSNYEGLIAYDSLDVEIFDPSWSEQAIFHNDGVFSGIFHSALMDGDVLNGLLEMDSGAYKKFIALIGG